MNEDKRYRDCLLYLNQFPLRSPEEERDLCAQWMANSQAYQESLTQALRQLEEANRQALSLGTQLERIRQELVVKDTSFKPPAGQA